MYFSGPDERFGDNTNQSTGKTAAEILAAYEEAYGEPPSASFWAHGYDATTLLLDAIKGGLLGRGRHPDDRPPRASATI